MTPWVLIRGLAREHGHWGQFPSLLADAFPGTIILTPDLPGNGDRRAEHSPVQVDAMAAALATQLAHAGHRPPYRVVALSLGAMVATAWATREPQSVERMVLINTSMRPFNPFYQRLRPSAWPTLLSALLPGRSPHQVERAILDLTSNGPSTRAATLPHWAEIAHARPVAHSNLIRQLIAAARFKAPATPPPTPTLVLASTQDRLASVRCSRRLARQWGCPCVEHPSAGHDLPLDDGPWVIEQIARWMSVSASQVRMTVEPNQGQRAGGPAPQAK